MKIAQVMEMMSVFSCIAIQKITGQSCFQQQTYIFDPIVTWASTSSVQSLLCARIFQFYLFVPYSIWNSRSLVGWSVSMSVRMPPTDIIHSIGVEHFPLSLSLPAFHYFNFF